MRVHRLIKPAGGKRLSNPVAIPQPKRTSSIDKTRSYDFATSGDSVTDSNENRSQTESDVP